MVIRRAVLVWRLRRTFFLGEKRAFMISTYETVGSIVGMIQLIRFSHLWRKIIWKIVGWVGCTYWARDEKWVERDPTH